MALYFFSESLTLIEKKSGYITVNSFVVCLTNESPPDLHTAGHMGSFFPALLPPLPIHLLLPSTTRTPGPTNIRLT